MPLQKEYIDWSPLQNMLARRNAYAAQEEQAGQQGALALGQQALQALVGSMSESDEDRRLKETREFQERMQQNQIAASAKEKNTERAWDERRFRELQAQRAFAREQEAVEAQRKEMWEQDQAAKEMAHKQAELRAREGKDARDYVARMQELEEQRRFHRAETARKGTYSPPRDDAAAFLSKVFEAGAAAQRGGQKNADLGIGSVDQFVRQQISAAEARAQLLEQRGDKAGAAAIRSAIREAMGGGVDQPVSAKRIGG